MIIIPNIAGKKDPVVYVSATSAHAGGSFGSLGTSTPVGGTVLYAMGAYQTNTSIQPYYNGVAMTGMGSTSTYGTCQFYYALKVPVANGTITTGGSVGSGFGHAAVWFSGADSITVVQAATAANGHTFTGSAETGVEMLVCLTGIPVGATTAGDHLVTKTDYFTTYGYGGAAVRVATDGFPRTWTTSTSWGMGNMVVLLKP